jgi:internalin A
VCQVNFADVIEKVVNKSTNSFKGTPGSKQNIKIFLASSSELSEEREKFEIFIGRKNKEIQDKNIFLDLVIWEDFLDAMSKTRLQDEYNKAIKKCDIFVSLFFTKVGKYTEEEFETAYDSFKSSEKPKYIYTYFKDAEISTGDITEDILTLLQFKKKLDGLGHFYTRYKNTAELLLHFEKQLQKIL